MEQASMSMESDDMYPVLLMPKRCTTLEPSWEVTENALFDLNITSTDTEGNEMCIYSGFCNVKLIDSYDVNVQHMEVEVNSPPETYDEGEIEVGNQVTYPYTQSQVWIDPARSPYVYNQFDATETQEYSISRTRTSHITLEHHNTHITQNVYNYKQSIHYSRGEGFEHKKFRKVQSAENQEANMNLYEEDEFECGVFLSHLPEEIINEKESKAREESRFIGVQSENGALKQLMSSDIQSVSKQRKTILFLGHDSHCGQTIQKIAVNDPTLVCSGGGEVDHEVVIDDTKPQQKKYQCDKCKQIFEQISTFKKHMVNHRTPRSSRSIDVDTSISNPVNEVKFSCTECGKNLKNQQKFEQHCMRHGDPELECSKCRKVFASKFTLRTHRKIHARKHQCIHCSKTYSTAEGLRTHTDKVHYIFMCDHCDHVADNYRDLLSHMKRHETQAFSKENSENDFTESLMDELTEAEMTVPAEEDFKLESDLSLESNHDNVVNNDINNVDNDVNHVDNDANNVDNDVNNVDNNVNHVDNDINHVDNDINHVDNDINHVNNDVNIVNNDEIQKADSVIAKVMSNNIFLLPAKKARRHRRYNKVCDVCLKVFDRVGDLKRHLIEHIIRSTLAKNPVSKNCILNIQCEVCQVETFTQIDRYKAHLREHAKLTLYKCTFCDKSFSDSSNFSKHKKIHGTTYLQCDLCQRKFNSKKMITQHMEYHNKHAPIKCKYCNKVFHFVSMLNKHVKFAHTRELSSRFRCRFCHNYFKTLKEKWDHEWSIHNVRKMIVDCLICGSKFRKYSELKRHCLDTHRMGIPSAKKLLKD